MYLITEFCANGELGNLYKKGCLSEEDTKVVIKRLASAVSYLHKHDIVHRDIKLENILLAENPVDPNDHLFVKVTDFGLSVETGVDNMMQQVCGTPMYMSPEILDHKDYSQQCDVWAMGVIAYMLISGKPPFVGTSEEALYELIRQADVTFSESAWDSVSIETKNCIVGMLKANPAHRLTASEVEHHAWITGVQSTRMRKATNVLEMMKQWQEETDADETMSISSSERSRKGSRRYSTLPRSSILMHLRAAQRNMLAEQDHIKMDSRETLTSTPDSEILKNELDKASGILKTGMEKDSSVLKTGMEKEKLETSRILPAITVEKEKEEMPESESIESRTLSLQQLAEKLSGLSCKNLSHSRMIAVTSKDKLSQLKLASRRLNVKTSESLSPTKESSLRSGLASGILSATSTASNRRDSMPRSDICETRHIKPATATHTGRKTGNYVPKSVKDFSS